jgi:ubiquinone/menaquinone biosynthesis C-methylase UbiE
MPRVGIVSYSSAQVAIVCEERRQAMEREAAQVHNPVFARWIYPLVSAQAEANGAAEHRRELLEGLRGRVIEVGAGNGLNFRHYPGSVSTVVAVEPEKHLRALAEKAATGSRVPIEVIDGLAEKLPAATGSFDAGVVSLVLCSAHDPDRALAELVRVIRPGGELRFYEHVVSRSAIVASIQRALDRSIWPIIGGGCHASRDTAAAIEAAGFRIEASRTFDFRPNLLLFPVAPHIIGRARRPG